MSFIKKLFTTLLVATCTFIGVAFFVQNVSAQVSPASFWKLVGSALFPVGSWDIGSSGSRIGTIYTNTLDALSLAVSGAISGDLTVSGNGYIYGALGLQTPTVHTTSTGLGLQVDGRSLLTGHTTSTGGIAFASESANGICYLNGSNGLTCGQHQVTNGTQVGLSPSNITTSDLTDMLSIYGNSSTNARVNLIDVDATSDGFIGVTASGTAAAWTFGTTGNTVTSPLNNVFAVQNNASNNLGFVIDKTGRTLFNYDGGSVQTIGADFNVYGNGGTRAFDIKDATDRVLLTVLGNGRVGVSSTAPGALLDVANGSTSDQARLPDGSVFAGGVPGISFHNYTTDGMSSNGTNLALWQAGKVALNLADNLLEFRIPSNYKWAWSSATDNNSSSDTSWYRNAAGVIRTGGSLTVDGSATVSTSVISPLHIGGTAVGSSLALQSTSGVGSSDFIKFNVGNNGATEAMRIITSGNVGIGDATPAAKFVVGSGDLFQVDSSGRVFLPAGASGGGALALSTTGDTDTGLYFSGANEMRWQTNGNDRITISANGLIGIATSTPAVQLDVAGDGIGSFQNASNPEIRLRRPGNTGFSLKNNAGTFRIAYTASDTFSSLTNVLSLNNSGRVGIGIDSPNTTLEVVGQTSSTSLSIGSGTAITGHLSGTASLNFGATAAGTCDTLTITVTGAADGDTVNLGIPNALASSDNYQSFDGYVSSANTVTVKRCNLTNTVTALSNPAAATVRADVWKH